MIRRLKSLSFPVLLVLVLGIAVIWVMVVYVVVVLTDDEGNREGVVAEEIKNVTPDYTLTAGQLFSAYEADEEGAEIAYKGKAVLLSGNMRGLVRDYGPVPYMAFEVDPVWKVKCFLSDEEVARVDPFRRGQQIHMKGKVGGLDDRFLSLDVHGCTVQDKGAD